MPAVDDATTLSPPDDAQEKYTLREPREIARVLRALVEARSIITANLVPGGHSCATALLDVREDGSLIFDGNRHEAVNRRIAAASKLVCSTQLDLVPIRFRIVTPQALTYEGYPAFSAASPDALLRLQRREMFRLQVSPSAPVTVHFGDGTVPPDATTGGLRVLDISGGGIAIAAPEDDQARFAVQTRLPPALLRIADADPLPVTLEVAHVGHFEVRGVQHWRVGCRFVGMNAAAEQRVLQYVFQIERQRNARQRRGG